ncbi:MAG: purine-nucleoside phosphorylase [Oligoflexia bacterium]|nr:purine-nucleoside phosphorylase [Oligoflexia bacterium]
MAARFGPAPTWAVVLGSGLGVLLDRLVAPTTASHTELGLPSPGVAGHAGVHAVGLLGGTRVLLVSGRLHLYEGHRPATVVADVRAMARWGVQKLVLTNAAGSCRPDWGPGTLMRLTDHINMAGANPLVGPNRDDLGPRFPDLARAYDPDLGASADALALELGVPLRRGVYAAMRGPSYETAAEVAMLHRLGADVVGMSTVPEVIAAVHAGMAVAAFSVVSNYGTGLTDEAADHAMVTRVVSQATAPLADLVARLVATD